MFSGSILQVFYHISVLRCCYFINIFHVYFRLWSCNAGFRQISYLRTLQQAESTNAAQPKSAADTISISDSCVERLKEICADDGSCLRITVEGGGCSGFQYKFDIVDNTVQEDDR